MMLYTVITFLHSDLELQNLLTTCEQIFFGHTKAKDYKAPNIKYIIQIIFQI